jgi:hypothetical protein
MMRNIPCISIYILAVVLCLSCTNKKNVSNAVATTYKHAAEAENEMSNEINKDSKHVSNDVPSSVDSNSNTDVWMEGKWVVSIGECSELNMTKEDAMKKALEIARKKAIQFVVGINISTATIFFRNDVIDKFSDYTSESSYGRIVQEQQPIWQEKILENDSHGLSIRSYKVTLKSKVEKEEGTPDPSFSIDVNTNKTQYKNGEIIQLVAKASQNCYLTIFNVFETEDKVMLIFPNDFDSNNKLTANQARKIPLESSGIVFKAILPSGKEITHELVWVLATKEYVDFSAGLEKATPFAYLATPQSAVIDIMKKLVCIPLDKRCLKSTVIQIEK